MMHYIRTAKDAEDFVGGCVLPPNEDPSGYYDASPFGEVVELAIAAQRDDSLNRIIDGDLLLAALRREWPEAVEAALVAMSADEPVLLPVTREPARMAAMA